MERFVLGIDIGTTSVKAVLVSSVGELVDEVSVPHDLISLHTGWAEEDADKWWNGEYANGGNTNPTYSGINETNYSDYYVDDMHPNQQGRLMYARNLIGYISVE